MVERCLFGTEIFLKISHFPQLFPEKKNQRNKVRKADVETFY